MTRLAGGSVCRTTPMSMTVLLSQALRELARHKAAVTSLSKVGTFVDDLASTGEHRVYAPVDPHALITGVVDCHVMCLGRDGLDRSRIVDDDIGVRSGRNGAFAWVEP